MPLCAIWGIEAEQNNSGGRDGLYFDSPRAGGKYFLTGSAGRKLAELSPTEKTLLTSWLMDQRKNGVEVPEINSVVLRDIKTKQPLSFSERVARFLEFCAKSLHRFDGTVSLIYQNNATKDANIVLAVCELEDRKDLWSFTHIVRDMGLLEIEATMDSLRAAPTARGWLRIDELQSARTPSAQCFVAMWFNSTMDDAYNIGIRPAIEEAGYVAMRIDTKEHANKIDDEIIAEIKRSAFVVADFTCEPNSVRGGVYYEAGYAGGLTIPVIWTCKTTSEKDLHFDTRQYNHIMWKDTAELKARLKNRILAVMGEGPKKIN